MESNVAEKFNAELEIMQINTTLDRLLIHHDDFKKSISAIGSKLEEINNRLHNEETSRLTNIQSIKDELHGRINQILFSILGGAGLFVAGIIMWIIETKK